MAQAAVAAGEGLGLPTLQAAQGFALALAHEDGGEADAAGQA